MSSNVEQRRHPLEAFAAGASPLSVVDVAGKVTRVAPSGGNTEFSDGSLFTYQPWHRAVAAMVCNAQPTTVVARAFDRTVDDIMLLRRQPHFKALIEQITKEKGTSGLAEAMGLDALTVLHELAMSSESQSVRQRAAQTLVECQWGKPKPGKGLKFSEVDEDPEEELIALKEEQKLLNKLVEKQDGTDRDSKR